jgi:gamma-glutamyl phosphate reductase
MLEEIGKRAKEAVRIVSSCSTDKKNKVLTDAARLLEENAAELITANEKDRQERVRIIWRKVFMTD